MKKTILKLLAVWLCLPATAIAQPHYFRHYQVENGLSNNTVYCSIQDQNGFMWFGTKDGLNRFDGYHFKTFHTHAGEAYNLTNDQIISLGTDQQGTLWAGLQSGIYFFDARKERLVPFIDTLRDVNSIHIDARGQLWFISRYTLYRYNFKEKKLTAFPPGRYFSSVSLAEADGHIWVASANGYLHQLLDDTGAFTSYNVFSHSPRAVSANIAKIVPGSNGELFIGTSNQGLKEFDILTRTYKDLLLYNPDRTTIFVRDMIQSAPQEFWCATESGIYVLNTETGKFTHLTKKFLDPYSLSDNAVYTLYRDREGGIWAGTYFGGINYLPKPYSLFQKYFADYSNNSISGDAVREICSDHLGNIWIGTEDAGLNKLNTQTRKITRFQPTGTPGSIAYSNIHGLLAVGNDLWVGTFEHGLDILDIRTGKVKKHFTAGPGSNDLKSNFIVCFLQTRSGSIYVGTSNGLRLYDAHRHHFRPCTLLPEKGFISCLLEDHLGTIWVGTHDMGVFYFNPLTQEKGHLIHHDGRQNELTANTVNAMYEDSALNVWIATEGGGLCAVSRDRSQMDHYTTMNGLPSNFIFKVLEDNNRTLWVTTSKGLVHLDLLRHKTAVYTKANGLLNDQFNYNSGFKDRHGKLYFGSVSGMITFNPDSFSENKFTAPLFVTGLQVQNREITVTAANGILNKSILFTDTITLPYDQSSFSIDFAALGFTCPGMTEYSYIMEGLDKEWTYLPVNRKVYFTNVEPGTYTLKIKAGHNGSWNPQIKTLSICIRPPFWATRWAYLLYLITFVSIVFYLVRLYHRIQRNKRDREIYEAKIDFFTNIAHEIKTPLTLIKGPVENLNDLIPMIPEISEEVATMERNTNRLVNLINQILDFRQLETKGFSLDFAPVNINATIAEVYETFRPMATKRKLSYSLHLPQHVVYTMADGEALIKIFNNLISNAVKYADKEIIIDVLPPDNDERKIIIQISNDGIIIPKEMSEKIFEPFFRIKGSGHQKGTGLGLALAQSLAELHNGHLYLKDHAGALNIFMLELPLRTVQSKGNYTTELYNQLINSNP